MTRRQLIEQALAGVEAWEARWGAVPEAPCLAPAVDLPGLLDEYARRMDAMLPFFHPRYAGQMLKPPHPVAVAAYLAAMIVNPNNHALDASQATSPMELECQVLGVESRAVAAHPDGRSDLDAIEAEITRGGVSTVVLTPGTTGVGAVDDIRGALTLRERHGVRLHVDGAYGGFYALLGEHDAYAAIAQCDSVVVDPHKHGLQPYGCGAVLFADPAVGRFYRHDSPYTYFTSDELHLGEISLECSRAGAGAAALWLTLQALPLAPDRGLGPVLRACRRAALDLAARIRGSEHLELHLEPSLDIVTYWPRRARMSEIDAASEAMLHAGMADAEDPVFLSTLRVDAGAFAALHPGITRDAGSVRVLRSVLMKPEHERWVEPLHARLEALAARA
jgi:glutamate/tyrosine decarboxylase-like PLP-dependent enzyme